jgi:Ni,Fe-hydrogenase III large subunit
MALARPFHHGDSIPVASIPVVDFAAFRASVLADVAAGGRIVSFFGTPEPDGTVRLQIVLAFDTAGTLGTLMTTVSDRFDALTPDCPQAHYFEREIAEQWGVVPEGHPWLKPIRFHHSYRPGQDAWGRDRSATILPCVPTDPAPFFRVEGREAHEVAVGPVHAGVIEPGHFRFQCHGETVFHLEIALGYQHRGIERALPGGPDRRTPHLMEQAAGDTSVGHATAYCQLLETLRRREPSLKAQAIRGIALELERLANHTGDLGALANDVGYLPTASFCGRLRGDWLNTTAILCGNRFGRSLVKPGGVAFDIEPARADEMIKKVEATLAGVVGAGELLWNALSVQSRFEDTGTVPTEMAQALGLVGPAGRASGIDRDIRHDFPSGIHRFAYIPIATRSSGDVHARAFVRMMEIRRSAAFILEMLGTLPDGETRPESLPAPLPPDHCAVSLVEGWRGEICHVARTDAEGRLAAYKIVDPSFHNWVGLMMALRGQQISDFPLCNKSFNLSYCGHDL